MTFDPARIRHVAVGSTNPVKIAAARAVLGRVAPAAAVAGVSVPSGVPDQPWGDAQTIAGAVARARLALGHALAHAGVPADAVLGVGIEGGVVDDGDGGLRTCAWAAIVDFQGRVGVGGSLAMPLPPGVAALVRGGMELGHAMDEVSRATATKRGPGAVGILTGGLMDRQQAYEPLVVYAMARFVSDPMWNDG
jgi:inosine/xanthosine triphosphatase